MSGWAGFWIFLAGAVWCSVKLEREKQRHIHEERMEVLRRKSRFDPAT